MRRHVLFLQKTLKAHVADLFKVGETSLSEGEGEHVMGLFKKLESHFDTTLGLKNWTEDAVLVKSEPRLLYCQLALQFVLMTVLAFLDDCDGVTDNSKTTTTTDDIKFATGMIILALFWKPGLDYKLTDPDRFDWLERRADSCRNDDGHDAFEYLKQAGAFSTVLWSRHQRSPDMRIRRLVSELPSFSFDGIIPSESKVINKVRQKVAEPLLPDEQLNKAQRSVAAYSQAKHRLLDSCQFRFVRDIRTFKSGLSLVGEDLVTQLEQIVNESAVERADDVSLLDADTIIAENSQTRVVEGEPEMQRSTSPPATSSTSTSSSSSRSTTPFQDATDMPAI